MLFQDLKGVGIYIHNSEFSSRTANKNVFAYIAKYVVIKLDEFQENGVNKVRKGGSFWGNENVNRPAIDK